MSDARLPEGAVLHYWAAISPKFSGNSYLVRVKILSKTNLVALKNIKRQNVSLPFDVRRPETSLLKLPIIDSEAMRARGIIVLVKSK